MTNKQRWQGLLTTGFSMLCFSLIAAQPIPNTQTRNIVNPAYPTNPSSDSVSLSSTDFGLTGPVSLNMNYDDNYGLFLSSQWTQALNKANALSLGLDLGRQQRRIDATYGLAFLPHQRLKLSAENLSQDMNFDFDSGSINKWVYQNAFGVGYQYLFPKSFINDINADAYYSRAISQSLGSRQFTGSDGEYINYRHIAGGTDKDLTAGVDMTPAYGTLLGAKLSYDDVYYNNRYEHKDSDRGIGGTVTLDQLITHQVKLSLLASDRQPYQSYEASLDWLLHSEPGTRLMLALTGSRLIGENGIKNDSQLGLGMTYTFGGSTIAHPAEFTLEPNASQEGLANWTGEPAVHMDTVLAVADQKSERLNSIDQPTNPALMSNDSSIKVHPHAMVKIPLVQVLPNLAANEINSLSITGQAIDENKLTYNAKAGIIESVTNTAKDQIGFTQDDVGKTFTLTIQSNSNEINPLKAELKLEVSIDPNAARVNPDYQASDVAVVTGSPITPIVFNDTDPRPFIDPDKDKRILLKLRIYENTTGHSDLDGTGLTTNVTYHPNPKGSDYGDIPYLTISGTPLTSAIGDHVIRLQAQNRFNLPNWTSVDPHVTFTLHIQKSLIPPTIQSHPEAFPGGVAQWQVDQTLAQGSTDIMDVTDIGSAPLKNVDLTSANTQLAPYHLDLYQGTNPSTQKPAVYLETTHNGADKIAQPTVDSPVSFSLTFDNGDKSMSQAYDITIAGAPILTKSLPTITVHQGHDSQTLDLGNNYSSYLKNPLKSGENITVTPQTLPSGLTEKLENNQLTISATPTVEAKTYSVSNALEAANGTPGLKTEIPLSIQVVEADAPKFTSNQEPIDSGVAQWQKGNTLDFDLADVTSMGSSTLHSIDFSEANAKLAPYNLELMVDNTSNALPSIHLKTLSASGISQATFGQPLAVSFDLVNDDASVTVHQDIYIAGAPEDNAGQPLTATVTQNHDIDPIDLSALPYFNNPLDSLTTGSQVTYTIDDPQPAGFHLSVDGSKITGHVDQSAEAGELTLGIHAVNSVGHSTAKNFAVTVEASTGATITLHPETVTPVAQWQAGQSLAHNSTDIMDVTDVGTGALKPVDLTGVNEDLKEYNLELYQGINTSSQPAIFLQTIDDGTAVISKGSIVPVAFKLTFDNGDAQVVENYQISIAGSPIVTNPLPKIEVHQGHSSKPLDLGADYHNYLANPSDSGTSISLVTGTLPEGLTASLDGSSLIISAEKSATAQTYTVPAALIATNSVPEAKTEIPLTIQVDPVIAPQFTANPEPIKDDIAQWQKGKNINFDLIDVTSIGSAALNPIDLITANAALKPYNLELIKSGDELPKISLKTIDNTGIAQATFDKPLNISFDLTNVDGMTTAVSYDIYVAGLPEVYTHIPSQSITQGSSLPEKTVSSTKYRNPLKSGEITKFSFDRIPSGIHISTSGNTYSATADYNAAVGTHILYVYAYNAVGKSVDGDHFDLTVNQSTTLICPAPPYASGSGINYHDFDHASSGTTYGDKLTGATAHGGGKAYSLKFFDGVTIYSPTTDHEIYSIGAKVMPGTNKLDCHYQSMGKLSFDIQTTAALPSGAKFSDGSTRCVAPGDPHSGAEQECVLHV